MKSISARARTLPVSAALAVDLRAKAACAAGRDVINFCVGEPDFDTPEHAKRAGTAAIARNDTKYTPAVGTAALRKAAAAALERDNGLIYAPEEIAITTGAKYAVYAAVLALTDPGDTVIVPAPYWTSYDHIVRLSGGRPITVRCAAENGWKLQPEQLDSAIEDHTKALILNNPNNPTGAVYSREELTALAAVCRRRDIYVIADEIYSRLLYTDEPFTAAASLSGDMRARTVSIGGVSKSYAMTGWRIGYAAGDQAIIHAIGAILSHTTGSPNAPAQAAAIAALTGPQDDTARMNACYRRRRDMLSDALADIPGLHFSVPQGAFYLLLDIHACLDDGAFVDESEFAMRLLDEEGVATVPGGDYGAPSCLRLSFTLGEERMLEGVQRLKRFMERHGI